MFVASSLIGRHLGVHLSASSPCHETSLAHMVRRHVGDEVIMRRATDRTTMSRSRDDDNVSFSGYDPPRVERLKSIVVVRRPRYLGSPYVWLIVLILVKPYSRVSFNEGQVYFVAQKFSNVRYAIPGQRSVTNTSRATSTYLIIVGLSRERPQP